MCAVISFNQKILILKLSFSIFLNICVSGPTDPQTVSTEIQRQNVGAGYYVTVCSWCKSTIPCPKFYIRMIEAISFTTIQYMFYSSSVLLGKNWRVPDFGGWTLDTDPNICQYWHFCGTIINVSTFENPYKMGNTR